MRVWLHFDRKPCLAYVDPTKFEISMHGQKQKKIIFSRFLPEVNLICTYLLDYLSGFEKKEKLIQ